MHSTSRLSLDVVDGTDNVSAYPTVDAQAKGVLDNAAIFLPPGTISARPAAGSTAAGTIYYATDTVQYFVCDGSAWQVWSLGQSGSSIVATSQSTSSTTYTTLTTPDQVTGLVLPASGLISVWYQATWQATTSGLNSAAIFLGSNQVVTANADAATPSVSACVYQAGAANTNKPLVSYPLGLTSLGIGDSNAYTGDVTTGQVVGSLGNSAFLGGPCYIFAAAGTYTVSIKFKASSGSVTASNRRLYVKVVPF